MTQNTQLITALNNVDASNGKLLDSCRHQLTEDLDLRRMRADYIVYQASHSSTSYSVGANHRYSNSNNALTSSISSNIIVVVPSIDLDRNEMKRVCSKIKYYEERQLYNLFLIVRDPSFRIIFMSSYPVNEEVVRYYLSIDGCSCDVLNERLSRLFLINTEELNDESQTLSENILKSGSLVQTVKNVVKIFSVGTKPTIGLSSYCGSVTMTRLEHVLKFRLLETSDKTLYLGSKQGSREIFRLCDIPLTPGCPDVFDSDLLSHPVTSDTCLNGHPLICTLSNLAKGISRMIVLKNIKPKQWVIKLNQGFSGMGNAMLDVCQIQDKKYFGDNGAELKGIELVNALALDIEKMLPEMVLQAKCENLTWRGDGNYLGYLEEIEKLGVIAEAFIDGEVVSFPSAQAIIDPENIDPYKVVIISTHEQIMKGQVYLGCINPANEEYRSKLVEYTMRVGRYLLKEGAIGHFSVDFIATKRSDKWDLFASEINLRQGGTTHPCCTMLSLCKGYVSDGIFFTEEGDQRAYKATDNFESPHLKGLQPKQFLESFKNVENDDVRRLQWNEQKKVGVIFHMLGSLQHGKIGFTAIGRNVDDATSLFKGTWKFLKSVGASANSENAETLNENLLEM